MVAKPTSTSEMQLFKQLLVCSPVLEGILSLLSPWEINSFIDATGIKLSKGEFDRYVLGLSVQERIKFGLLKYDPSVSGPGSAWAASVGGGSNPHADDAFRRREIEQAYPELHSFKLQQYIAGEDTVFGKLWNEQPSFAKGQVRNAAANLFNSTRFFCLADLKARENHT
jgi:hypothetical protein